MQYYYIVLIGQPKIQTFNDADVMRSAFVNPEKDNKTSVSYWLRKKDNKCQ